MKRSPAGYLLAVGEAVCMPLQGALNAAVYGWSLPSIRRAPHSILKPLPYTPPPPLTRPRGHPPALPPPRWLRRVAPPRTAGTSTASCCLGPIASRPRTRRATRSRRAAARTPRPLRLAPLRFLCALRSGLCAPRPRVDENGRTRRVTGAVACGVGRLVHASGSDGGEHQDGTRHEQSTEFSLGSSGDHELASEPLSCRGSMFCSVVSFRALHGG